MPTTPTTDPAAGSFYARMLQLCDLHHSVGDAVILKGRIGEGKTSLIDHLAERDTVAGVPVGGVVTLRLAGKSADAVNGIPVRGTTEVAGAHYDTSRETIPKWALEMERLAAGGKIVYGYIQEINLGYPDAIAAMQDLLLERRLPNGYQLPSGCRLIGDMNPRAEVNGTFDLSDAVPNRVAIYDFEVPLYDWTSALVWGFPGEDAPDRWLLHYRSAVAAFLTAFPEYVYESRELVDRAECPWASKRSWTRLCDVLAAAGEASGEQPEDAVVQAVVDAKVGPRAGGQFRSWLAGFTVPSIGQMVTDPTCLDGLDTAAANAAVGSLVSQAVAASRDASGAVTPATVPDSPVSLAVGVLNHLRSVHPDIAAIALLRLIREAGQAAHGVALLDPSRVADGFVAPSSHVDSGFAASSVKVSALLGGLQA
ncbi:hypothetical protein [Corynebacterium sp. AOP12-C2-36]|uniref:hypothetical protein n=1 Tax=Corynebacterium sp. AOP12-C2-36 TaxID=3457723 RepID=UPI0040344661